MLQTNIYKLKSNNYYVTLKNIDTNSTTRTPVHIVICLDMSGSMDMDDKYENCKDSITFLLQFLNENDYISFITFSDYSHIHMNKQNMSIDNKNKLRTILNTIQPNGSTNLSSALLDIHKCITNETSSIKDGVIILTDGLINMGIIEPNSLIKVVDNILENYPLVTISTIGYGEDHNIDVLSDISNKGKGSYNYIKNREDTATTFASLIGGLMSCTYTNTQIEVPENITVKCSYNLSKTNILQIGDIYVSTDIDMILYQGDSISDTRSDMSASGMAEDEINTSTSSIPTIVNQINVSTYNVKTHVHEIHGVTVHQATDKIEIDAEVCTIRELLGVYMKNINFNTITHYQKTEFIGNLDTLNKRLESLPDSIMKTCIINEIIFVKDKLENSSNALDSTAIFTQRYMNIGRGFTDTNDTYLSPIQREMTSAARTYCCTDAVTDTCEDPTSLKESFTSSQKHEKYFGSFMQNQSGADIRFKLPELPESQTSIPTSNSFTNQNKRRERFQSFARSRSRSRSPAVKRSTTKRHNK